VCVCVEVGANVCWSATVPTCCCSAVAGLDPHPYASTLTNTHTHTHIHTHTYTRTHTPDGRATVIAKDNAAMATAEGSA
jgi:hypothetical protein